MLFTTRVAPGARPCNCVTSWQAQQHMFEEDTIKGKIVDPATDFSHFRIMPRHYQIMEWPYLPFPVFLKHVLLNLLNYRHFFLFQDIGKALPDHGVAFQRLVWTPPTQ